MKSHRLQQCDFCLFLSARDYLPWAEMDELNYRLDSVTSNGWYDGRNLLVVTHMNRPPSRPHAAMIQYKSDINDLLERLLN